MKILIAFHSPQIEPSSSSRGIEQMCSENTKPWANVLQAVLSVKLPWSLMNNQGPHFLSFPNLDMHSEPCMSRSFITWDWAGSACIEICTSSENQKRQTSQSISYFLLLEFKRLSGFWSTTRRSDLLLQYIFTEYLWCVYCPLYSYCSTALPGPRMFPQYWGCNRSTSGNPGDPAYIYLYVWHVIDSSGENMKCSLWRRNLSHGDYMSLTLPLQDATVTASLAGQTSFLSCHRKILQISVSFFTFPLHSPYSF